MPRIISLIASATEIVCALGFENQIVGRSHECDYPEAIKRLPICTEPKFDPDGTSYQIDQRVKAIVQEGLSVYRVDGEKLRELEPDVIVTQSHCEVCAVSLRDVERAVCAWLRTCPQLVSLSPNGLADVWTSIEQVADALKVPERGAEVIRRLQGRMDGIAAQHAPSRRAADRDLYRMDRSADGGRQLDAGDGRDGRRRAGLRRRRRSFAVDDLGATLRRRSRHPPPLAVRLRHRADPTRLAYPDEPTGMAEPSRRAYRPCLPGRRQSVFQPAWTAPGRIAGDPRGIAASQCVRIRSRGNGMARPKEKIRNSKSEIRRKLQSKIRNPEQKSETFFILGFCISVGF